MAKLPKKATERITAGLKRFQPILTSAKSRDVNESDTAIIVSDLLNDIFGYDLSDSTLDLLRRESRRISPNVRIEKDEIPQAIQDEVLKRDVLEGEGADAARKRVARSSNRSLRQSKQRGKAPTTDAAVSPQTPPADTHGLKGPKARKRKAVMKR